MNNEDRQLLKEIKSLHKEIISDYKKSVDRCIRLGGILKKQKSRVGHGNFIKWVKSYLPFSERSSRNYMVLHHYKARLKKEKVNSLREAYRLISNFNVRKLIVSDSKKLREEFANSNTKYRNPSTYINRVICGDNYDVMSKMLKKGMGEKYTAIITSPPYNANMNYGKGFDDNKPYDEYIKDLLKPFPLYSKLLRTGGRVIYIIGSLVLNREKGKKGDYNHQVITDLTYRVREQFPEFRFMNNIIWNKGEKRRNIFDTRWGSYCSPTAPLCRSCHENILVWSKDKFELENIEGSEPDITENEFKEWSWSVWNISTYTRPNNPHPCSYPHKLVERLLKYYSFKNDLILDSYAGIGITAQMCKRHKRRYTMLELNPAYCKWAKEKLGNNK